MNLFKKTSILLIAVVFSFSLFAAETSMIVPNTNRNENPGYASSIRPLKNKLFTDEKEKEKAKTIEFKVSGICEMCEKRIENAALIKGVKMADWDKEAQKIKVVYRPDKTDEQSIHQAIAKAGHDTEKVKAAGEAYNKLHECCKYREGQVVH